MHQGPSHRGENRSVPEAADRLIRLHHALDRTRAPAASFFLERALALTHLGETDLALRDLDLARSIDPEDPTLLALRCKLAADRPPTAEDRVAARELITHPTASAALRHHALPCLDPADLPKVATHLHPTCLRVIVLKRPEDEITLQGSDADDHLDLLRAPGSAKVDCVDLVVARRAGQDRSLTLGVRGQSQRIEVPALPAPQPAPVLGTGDPAWLWIVMPLHDGGDALAAALSSVLAELKTHPAARLILVDDGSHRPETAARLKDCMARAPGQVQLLRNEVGSGFTAAVNLGLSAIGPGPVLLLNSDVWLPAGTLARLRAHLDDPEIGTVTPLSNSAGSFSLLGPGVLAAMPAPALCDRLAAAAARLNPGLAIDVPCGNGFALLISEACLRAVAPLSTVYESGYYEDVDLCLRASRLGWRHVAAADCFVGHVGSVTYGAQKRALVARNRRRLHQRFPDHAATYARFTALDPLAEARHRLLAALAPDWVPHPQPEPARAEGVRQIRLPDVAGGPVLLPSLTPLPRVLETARFARLRPVPATALVAAGLAIDPDHSLHLTQAPDGHAILLTDTASRATLAALPLGPFSAAASRAFEAQVLAHHGSQKGKTRSDAVST
ncbi:GT2 family glycosyltransferase [Rhodobacter viridis]|uniref:GT2 family glycosyltransferase n=1 Tax=Rhodobacter viridis TaxID=1054202 RepID=A0A318TZA4_9RHOB|nr:glycosyltransferase [Rhodobacter viridis]PYF07455.1 GT2 family glycosyltransferase [Rhodobacter viridis]